jgi:pimeloyl-ACP methyl ester carboxylesterase
MTTNACRIESPRGPIEFTVAGSGQPILYLHGTPCSSQFAIDMEQWLVEDGFQLIVPQRPGYYGTPLSDRTTTADCAELATTVLDHLAVGAVAVMGTSGGGPPALAFAARYPDRTSALVLQCAQSRRWDDACWAPTSYQWLFHCYRWSLSRRMFGRFYPALLRAGFPTPEHYLRYMTGDRFDEVRQDPYCQWFSEASYAGVSEYDRQRPGYLNDLATWIHEDVLSTGRVTCPTLVLHDRKDPAAPFCHAEFAAAAIPGAELMELHAGGHLIWCGRDASAMRRRRTEFLRRQAA